MVSLITTSSVCAKKKSIADAYRNFIKHTGKDISRSSFWDRLANKKLGDFIEKAVLKFSFHIQGKALSKLSWLSSFNDVFIYDASPIRLPAGLANIFPGNRKNHSPACLKLSALYRLSVRTVEWIKFSEQKSHDSKFLPDLNQLKGALFLFDLGYYSHTFLQKLSQLGVWFVCRLKANSVPIITKVIKGISKKHIGRPLNKNVNLRGPIVEVWGKLNLPGKKSFETRFIGFRLPFTKQYRWYVTNIESSMVPAEWIYPIYSLRWQIELFFKSIKSMLHADQITSENKNIVLVTAYSTVLVSLVANSVIIEYAVVTAEKELSSVTAQRIAHVFSLLAHDLAKCILKKDISAKSFKASLQIMLPLLECPNNKHRPTSLQIVVMFNPILNC